MMHLITNIAVLFLHSACCFGKPYVMLDQQVCTYGGKGPKNVMLPQDLINHSLR